MLAYLVLAGANGAPVDPDLVARFDHDDLPELPFHPDERIVWRNRDGSVVFVGWQAFTELAELGSHWTVDESGLTAFSGHCWPRATGWAHGTGRSWADQLREHLRTQPNPRAARESLYGHFTVVELAASGDGSVVPDWAGVDQLFVAELPNATALSNRAGLCAQALARGGSTPQRSLAAAGWLISQGWILDQESGYWEVDRPRAGSTVVIDAGRGVTVVEPEPSPFLPPTPECPRPSYDELLDETERDLRQTVCAIADLPLEERTLWLSGGKDSRTILGIILSEDLRHRFRFVTFGSPERGDAIVARSIADRYGLDWSLLDASNRPPETEVDNVRAFTSQVEGATSGWGIMHRFGFGSNLAMTGSMGEGLRWGATTSAALGATTVEDAIAALRKQRPNDPLGVLLPEMRAYYDAFYTEWVHQQIERDVPLTTVSALLKQEAVLHCRLGPEVTWNPYWQSHVYSTPVCIRANHRLPLDQRPDPRFHLDLQHRCAPELSKMPFAGPSWTEDAYRHLPDADDYRSIAPVVSRHPDGRTWRQKRYADYRPAIDRFVLDRDNPLSQVLDYDRLHDRLATGDAHPGRTRHVWGLLTAAIWMGHHELPDRIRRS